jgi:hypothetical protein
MLEQTKAFIEADSLDAFVSLFLKPPSRPPLNRSVFLCGRDRNHGQFVLPDTSSCIKGIIPTLDKPRNNAYSRLRNVR